MKQNSLIILFLLIGMSALAQQYKQDVIASAGGYNVASGNTISISWTLGETIIPTFTSSDKSLILTHGFQQKLIITAVEENIVNPVKVTIFPNPASEIINIRFEKPTEGEVMFYLMSNQGSLVKTGQVDPGTTSKEINMQDLPSGIYFLRLTQGKATNVYKVVKL